MVKVGRERLGLGPRSVGVVSGSGSDSDGQCPGLFRSDSRNPWTVPWSGVLELP